MANYTENFASKLDWAMPFQRTGSFPLDRTDLFSSYEDAVKYAAGDTSNPDSRGLCGTSYVGQTITVFENDKVSLYMIQSDRSLFIVSSTDASNNDELMQLIQSKEEVKIMDSEPNEEDMKENQLYMIEI